MLELALVGCALLALGVAVGLQHRRQQRAQRDLLTRLDHLQKGQQQQARSLQGLASGTGGLNRRLSELEGQLRVARERLDIIEAQQATEQPYAHAIRLVRQGVSAQRLVEELELSASEAELIVRLHGRRSAE